MRVLVVAVFLATACEPVPPQSMRDVDFPEGFQLDTQQEVSVVVTGADAETRLAIRTMDGRSLYEGPASFVQEHGLVLRVPPGTRHLEVDPGGDAAFEVPISDAREARIDLSG